VPISSPSECANSFEHFNSRDPPSFSSSPLVIYDDIVDVLLLLPRDHPAVYCFKLLFNQLPRFTFNSPVPYTSKNLERLHNENLSILESYLCLNNLSLPCQLEDVIHKRVPVPFIHVDSPFSHVLHRLKRILNLHELLILPADKTKQMVVLPQILLDREMKIHLDDTNTYTNISEDYQDIIRNLVIEIISDASSIFGWSNLFINRPRTIYMYFLTKTHKDLSCFPCL
jgi:hypothetical protein